jgi:hypothetical protein
MDLQGTCNGVQGAAVARIGAATTCPSLPNRGENSRVSQRTARLQTPQSSEQTIPSTPVPVPGNLPRVFPSRGNLPFIQSQQSQYLPFLFQTARVEVGRLVMED